VRCKCKVTTFILHTDKNIKYRLAGTLFIKSSGTARMELTISSTGVRHQLHWC